MSLTIKAEKGDLGGVAGVSPALGVAKNPPWRGCSEGDLFPP